MIFDISSALTVLETANHTKKKIKNTEYKINEKFINKISNFTTHEVHIFNITSLSFSCDFNEQLG